MKRHYVLSPALIALLSGCSSLHGDIEHPHTGADYCAEYRETMAGKSMEEQRRVAEVHIVQMHGSADPAHVERHMRMMQQRCAPKRDG